LPHRVRITDVGPRDGLQNESGIVPLEAKVAFVNQLARTGVAEVEASSFVSPKWVPQLGDAEELFRRIDRPTGVVISALVPNEKGFDRAMALGEHRPDKVAIFTAASETFSQRNTNATIAETIDRFAPVIEGAKKTEIPVRAYISCVVACPYEGAIAPIKVREVIERLMQFGLDPDHDDFDLGETIGVAAPNDIEILYDELEDLIEPRQTTLHLHDTRGTALACAYAAMQLGVVRFDASCGGLGGCPYAPGAAGNLATEDLIYLCQRMHCETGVSLDRLFEAGRQIAGTLGRSLPGRVFGTEAAGRADSVSAATESTGSGSS
ncbi:MAG: hydroxymethylglutaryl-CoA lyase, partial [Phycisphaerales bacterium]